MPVTVNEVVSQIEVEPAAGHSAQQPDQDAAQTLQRWLELARWQQQREARTAAWNFDD